MAAGVPIASAQRLSWRSNQATVRRRNPVDKPVGVVDRDMGHLATHTRAAAQTPIGCHPVPPAQSGLAGCCRFHSFGETLS